VSMRKHLEQNRKDKDGKFRLILVESRIHRLARYYKVGLLYTPCAVAGARCLHLLPIRCASFLSSLQLCMLCRNQRNCRPPGGTSRPQHQHWWLKLAAACARPVGWHISRVSRMLYYHEKAPLFLVRAEG
jgi:hypothetical protein